MFEGFQGDPPQCRETRDSRTPVRQIDVGFPVWALQYVNYEANVFTSSIILGVFTSSYIRNKIIKQNEEYISYLFW